MQKKSIGIFDSGYGGLTILKDIVELLPQYNYIYLGDNARAPYGNKSFDTVYEYTLQGVNALFHKGCELIILACNTASAKALRSIQQNDLKKWDAKKRVLGVIRPSTECIDKFTTTKEIGILGTTGTVNSQSYLIEIQRMFPHIKTHQMACPIWVSLVENNEIKSRGSDYFIQRDLHSILNKHPRIDTLLLACTHYPLLIPTIQKFIPSNVFLLSQGEIVAKSLQNYLLRHHDLEQSLATNAHTQYWTTGDITTFNERASLFLGNHVSASFLHL